MSWASDDGPSACSRPRFWNAWLGAVRDDLGGLGQIPLQGDRQAAIRTRVSDDTICRALKDLSFSHLSARPKAYKQDSEAVEAFK